LKLAENHTNGTWENREHKRLRQRFARPHRKTSAKPKAEGKDLPLANENAKALVSGQEKRTQGRVLFIMFFSAEIREYMSPLAQAKKRCRGSFSAS